MCELLVKTSASALAPRSPIMFSPSPGPVVFVVRRHALQSSLAAMEGQNRKNGAKTPSIMHTNEPNMQFLGSKLLCA